jgi:octaprenyl-diphosphate synthase
MDKLEAIRAVVSEEWEDFRREYAVAMQGMTGWLQECIDFLMKKQGKQIRPLLTLLSAKVCDRGVPAGCTVQYAVLLEMLHTATLVHDDIVDDTHRRRGNPTLNAAFDNRLAVLTGDYLLSNVIVRAVALEDRRIIHLLSGLGRNLAEGEVTELELAEKSILDEEAYMQVIGKKTVALLSACTELGGLSGGGTEAETAALRAFGEHLGYCFQIRDDLFDYYDAEVGKPTGHDICEGKITLPLLFALRRGVSVEADESRRIIVAKDFSEENVRRLIAFAKRSGGIAYAEQVMADHLRSALTALESFPSTPSRQALAHLAEHIITRTT